MKKTTLGLMLVAAGQIFVSSSALAQYSSPRSYMNRLNPQPPATRRVAPAPAPAVVPAQRFAITNAAVNSEKAKIEKEELLKRTVAFEKEQAAAGSPTFQYELGVRYLTGDGVEPDLTEAKNWLTKAAKNGNKDAVAKLEELKKLETEKPDPNKKDAAK